MNLPGETPRRMATDLSQAIWFSPGCGVAVCADAGGHAVIRLWSATRAPPEDVNQWMVRSPLARLEGLSVLPLLLGLKLRHRLLGLTNFLLPRWVILQGIPFTSPPQRPQCVPLRSMGGWGQRSGVVQAQHVWNCLNRVAYPQTGHGLCR
jgi:hypothetical protein